MFFFEYWGGFYKYVGKKLYLLILLCPIIGALESVSLALLIPVILSSISTDQSNKAVLTKLYSFLEYLHIPQSTGWLFFILITLFLLKSTFKGLYLYLSSHYNAFFIKKLKILVVEGIKQMDYRHYSLTNTGKVINNASNEIYKYATAMKNYTESISALFILGSYLAISFYISYKITLVIVMIGGTFSFLYKSLNKKAKSYSTSMVKTNIEFKNIIIETISFFKYLKATEKLDYPSSKLRSNVKEFTKLFYKTNLTNGLPNVIQEPIGIIMIIIIFGFNYWFLQEPMAKLVMILALSYRASAHISVYQGKVQSFYSNAGSIAAVTELMKELDQAKEVVAEGFQFTFDHSLELKNITFSYDKGTKVLDDISIIIPRNKIVAFVGPSGAGKSTLIDLLTGILKPDSGAVYLDGQRIPNLAIKEWRTGIGYITQENIVFNTSLEENISLKAVVDEKIQQKVEAALQSAHALEFSRNLNEGLDTILGERGVRLSGGQRQRVSIAREIFKKPNLLILDEATSALDASSENIVQESINDLKGKTTIVLIAHRLATVRHADIIYVIDNGKIFESGSFEDLITLKGYFYKESELQGLL